MRLTIPGTTCSSVVWASHERVAAGCNNGQPVTGSRLVRRLTELTCPTGHVAIWDIEAALKTGKATGESSTHELESHYSVC